MFSIPRHSGKKPTKTFVVFLHKIICQGKYLSLNRGTPARMKIFRNDSIKWFLALLGCYAALIGS